MKCTPALSKGTNIKWPCTVGWELEELEELQPAPCITIAPVSVDRGEIYDRKCYGCKRPRRGMKSKTPLRSVKVSVGGRQGKEFSYIYIYKEAGFINEASVLAERESAAKTPG